MKKGLESSLEVNIFNLHGRSIRANSQGEASCGCGVAGIWIDAAGCGVAECFEQGDGGDRDAEGGEDEFSASMQRGFDGAGQGAAEFGLFQL